jgi:carboxyl-terminal processing protease
VLKVGSVGEPVRRLQRSLTASGLRTTIDGVFSKRTARAVVRYQRKAGLPTTGVVAAELWDRLLGR